MYTHHVHIIYHRYIHAIYSTSLIIVPVPHSHSHSLTLYLLCRLLGRCLSLNRPSPTTTAVLNVPTVSNPGQTCWKIWTQWAHSIHVLPWPWWWGGGHLLSSSRETGSIFLARLFGVHPDPSIFFPTADSTLAELICRNRRTPIARRGSTADVVWDPRRPRC